MTYYKTVVLLFLFLAHQAQGQLNSSQIDPLMQQAMDQFKVAGAAIGIVKNGRIIHQAGYGVKSVETGQLVNQHSLFAIASNSKAFTTTALALLVDQGKIQWTDRVVKYIPEFKMYNNYVTQNFNILDLLTHRSGLGLGAGDLMLFPQGSDFTVDDILTAFQYFEPESAFRTKYDYDNLLYIVAGELVSRVSGMSWEAFVKQNIMEPLGMDSSYTTYQQIPAQHNLSQPHTVESGEITPIQLYQRDPDKINGASGGIFSNVNDLCQWMLMHLNQGRFGSDLEQQLFSPAQQKEMWRIHTVLPVSTDNHYTTHFAGYGLGWHLKDLDGHKLVSHTGSWPGMLSQTMMIPDLELGLVILTNTSPGGVGLYQSVSRKILDHYLAKEEKDWISNFHKKMESNQVGADTVTRKVWHHIENNKFPSPNLSDYLGIYQDPWFGQVEVLEKNGQLWFRSFRSPRLTGAMYHYKNDSFAVKWKYRDMNADAFVIFERNDQGQAETIRMKGISPLIDFSFDFRDLRLKKTDL